jgi:predicted nuclease of predicted toxin-antitoxin system
VKFLIDAQLPARLAELLNGAGHDALHTSGLPDRHRSTDSQISERADTDGRVVVTKDQDFRDAHLLARSPRKLFVVATGNITIPPPIATAAKTASRSTPHAEIVLEVGAQVSPARQLHLPARQLTRRFPMLPNQGTCSPFVPRRSHSWDC